MPYIDQLDYDRLRPHSECVARTPGELTFQLQQIVQQYLLDAYETHGCVRYADLAEVMGSIDGLTTDFKDRILLPYEAVKAATNGDVWDSRLVATNPRTRMPQ